jgi:hypothetical protein
VELRKLLDKQSEAQSLAGAQFMLDTNSYERHLFNFRRAEGCRFDHATWPIEPLALAPQANTLADLFAATAVAPEAELGIEGQVFVTSVACSACGKRASFGLSLFGRIGEAQRTCGCGGRMHAMGFFSTETIRPQDVPPLQRRLPLASIGFRSGDVVSVASPTGTARYLELGGILPNG